MKKATWWIGITLLIFLFAPSAHAETHWVSQLRDTDLQFRQALIRGAAASLDRLVADDAKIIHGASGKIAGKRALIERFRSWQIDVYERTPLLTEFCGGLAVMLSETRKVANGQETLTSTTEVFTRRAGRWQILVLQNTDRPTSATN